MSIAHPAAVEEPISPIALDLMEAALVSCGEIGYLGTSVGHIIARAHRSRGSFYRFFRNKADCFQRAYERKASWLVSEFYGAAEGGQCEMRRCLLKLGDFLVQEPLQARAVLVEAKIAEGTPSVRRRQRLQSLAEALDSGHRRAPCPEPPSCAGEFAVGAIESIAGAALARGKPEDFLQAIPELVVFVNTIYGG
jgi:AcrR family transcriptional regulator